VRYGQYIYGYVLGTFVVVLQMTANEKVSINNDASLSVYPIFQ
jgi:hypothetical protein